MSDAAVLTLLLSLSISLVIIATARWHGRFTHDHRDAGVQKIHSRPVPRVGGIAIAAGFILGSSSGLSSIDPDVVQLLGWIFISALPSLIGGLIEDFTKSFGPRPRMIATLTSGILFAWLSGVWLTRVDIPVFDQLLSYLLIGIPFTAFAIAGIANSINIIDGINGLASGISVVLLLAIAAIAYQVDDIIIMHLALVASMSVLGFLLVNFPQGRIFMGDGGAYFVGFLIAQLAVLLVSRNPQVTPWAFVSICSYPLVETLFSILRRSHRTDPMQPDCLHLHSLLYARYVRRWFPRHRSDYLGNAMTAPPLWMLAFLPIPFAVLWSGNTMVQVGVFSAFAVLYNALYTRMITFRWCWRTLLGLRARPKLAQDVFKG